VGFPGQVSVESDSTNPGPESVQAIKVGFYYLVVSRDKLTLTNEQLSVLDDLVTGQPPQSVSRELVAWSAMWGGALEPLMETLVAAAFDEAHLYPGLADSLDVSVLGGRIGGRFEPGDSLYPEHPERWRPLTPWLSGRWFDSSYYVCSRRSL
jgi:hypothetical protein